MKHLRLIAAPAFAVFALLLFGAAEPALAVKNTGGEYNTLFAGGNPGKVPELRGQTGTDALGDRTPLRAATSSAWITSLVSLDSRMMMLRRIPCPSPALDKRRGRPDARGHPSRLLVTAANGSG
ncbi:MAG: hypothetical protein ACREWG_09530 [Gammaproteobacteria bacterium]